MPAGEVKLRELRDAAKDELSQLMSRIAVGSDKSKGVLIEPHLMDALQAAGLIDECLNANAGVQFVYPLDLKSPCDTTQIRSLVILVRPSLPLMKTVATVINIFNSHKNSLRFHVFFVPKKTFICCHMLEHEYRLLAKYDKRLEIDEYELDFFQLEEDVLSMEIPFLLRDIFMEGDTTALQYISRALVNLQTAKIGLIPRIFAKGSVAVRTLAFLKRMISDVGAEFMQEQATQVDRMYLIDRGVDLVTPLVTQLTYEGVIDEAYNIRCGSVKPPFDVTGLKPQHKGRVVLNNAVDGVFYSLRDLNITQVGGTLHKISLSVKKAYDQRNELSKARDLRNFLVEIPERHRLVGVHTSIATQLIKLTQSPAFRRHIDMEHNVLRSSDEKEVLEYVDELLNRGEPILSVLRFLCLMSVTSGGLKPKLYDALRESFMMSHGIPQTLVAWYNLERAGLLTRNTTGLLAQAGALAALGQFQLRDRDGRVPFNSLRKACRLWIDDLNEQTPNDIGYAYSGYAPLALRVVEAMDAYANKGFDQRPPLASNTPASSTTTAAPTTTGLPAIDQAPGDFDVLITGAEKAPSQTRTVIIFFIGGITAAEISAIRTILGTPGENEGGGRCKTQYIIATTCVTNGAKMLETLLPFDV